MAQRPRVTPARQAEQQARAARLAKALRDNLQRRKAQSRARQPDNAPADGGTDPAAPRS